MRRLVVGLLAISLVLLVVDRVGAALTAGVVAQRLQVAGDLPTEPDVTIGGFPFLTQALSGRYDRVELQVEDVQRRNLSLARLDVAVLGAQLSLGEAVQGAVTAVPVEGLRATAVVSYDEVVRRSGLRGAVVTPLPDGVRIAGSVRVLGRTVRASTSSAVRVDRGEIVVTARSIEVQGRSSALLDRAIRGRFDFRIDVAALPYGLRLTQVRAADDGLALTARTGPTVLQRP